MNIVGADMKAFVLYNLDPGHILCGLSSQFVNVLSFGQQHVRNLYDDSCNSRLTPLIFSRGVETIILLSSKTLKSGMLTIKITSSFKNVVLNKNI